MSAARRRHRYHRATLEALLRHLTQPGHSTKTYLATHPRVSQAQIDAIFEDLLAAVDRMARRSTWPSGDPGNHPESAERRDG